MLMNCSQIDHSMSRSVPFRRTVSDAVSWRQDQAQNATIYILREVGPTGFLLKEEGEVKKFKVYLGDPHTCTCPVYKKEKDLCKHICWVLLKKFRIPREDSESFQLGLVEREINALLRGRTQQESRQKRNVAKAKIESGSANAVGNGKEVLPQREITQEDVCPICQDEFLATREPVTYCRFGCAKSIHIKCMKVWAEHQQSTGETTIKCPLCREDFGEIEFLQKEYRNSSLQKTQAERGVIHRGVVCFQCNQSPIAGRCYRCMECRDKFLCQECFSSNSHSHHEFQFCQKPNQRWRPAQRSSGGALPEAVLTDMQNRELQDEDYELLLQLDSNDANRASMIPEEVVKSFPIEKIREGGALTSPGVQCRVCLRGFTVGQVARRLPCRHKFHKDCIDRWLIHEHPTCPVDGTVVWNPLTANLASQETRKSKTNRPGINNHDEQPQNNQLDLSGLGVTGVSARTHDATPGRRRTGVIPGTDQGGSGGRVDGLSAEFQLMGLGFGSQQNASSSDNGSKDGQLRQGKLRATPSQRTGLFSASQVNSIPSNQSYPDGQVFIDSSTLAASQKNALAEDEIGAVAYANYGRGESPLRESRASQLSADVLMNRNMGAQDVLGAVAYANEGHSRASQLSADLLLNIHDVHDENRNRSSNMTTFNGLSTRTEPRHKPPSGGTKGRRSKPPEGRDSSTPSSALNNQGENNFGLTTSRLTMSNSAPSTSSRASTSSRSPGKINPERGRRERRNEFPGARRRARSTSTGRKTPSDRLHPSQPEKLEVR
ncbi:uncharacterized protein [Apostichopus japonicus]|uniref:uncharacterized protein isoform X3 n=1 Tax=Stichopus japonicus TaxID=307972 RepID=UPI003AB86203